MHNLYLANLAYIRVMKPVLETADPTKSPRREPLRTGLFGRWFLYGLEPPSRMKSRALDTIVPASSLEAEDAVLRC